MLKNLRRVLIALSKLEIDSTFVHHIHKLLMALAIFSVEIIWLGFPTSLDHNTFLTQNKTLMVFYSPNWIK